MVGSTQCALNVHYIINMVVLGWLSLVSGGTLISSSLNRLPALTPWESDSVRAQSGSLGVLCVLVLRMAQGDVVDVRRGCTVKSHIKRSREGRLMISQCGDPA